MFIEMCALLMNTIKMQWHNALCIVYQCCVLGENYDEPYNEQYPLQIFTLMLYLQMLYSLDL